MLISREIWQSLLLLSKRVGLFNLEKSGLERDTFLCKKHPFFWAISERVILVDGKAMPAE